MYNTDDIKKLLKHEIDKLINEKWYFLDNIYPIIKMKIPKKNKNIKSNCINDIKKELYNKLGSLPIFIFLTDIFYKLDLLGPYNHVDKCLFLIYQLVEGKTINEMITDLNLPSYYVPYKDFYVKNKLELDSWLNKMLYNDCFSTNIIRILTSRLNNPKRLKNVTCFLNEYDSRICYKDIHFDRKRLYSIDFNSSGYKTQFIIDSNMFILYVSFPSPSNDYSCGEMINNINFKNIITYTDCILLDDIYIEYLEDVIKNDNEKGGFLSNDNFYYQINIKNTEIDNFICTMKKFLTEFTNLFKRFNKKSTITESYCYNLQLKLCCVLYNIKRACKIYEINDENDLYKQWLNDDFEYEYEYNDNNINEVQNNLIYKLMSKLNIDNDIYEVEKIIKHRIYNGKKEYFVKWKGYAHSENSWVLEEDFIEKECIQEYWNKVNKI